LSFLAHVVIAIYWEVVVNKTLKAILLVVVCLLVAGAIVGLLILEEASYEVLWEATADGTVGLEAGDAVDVQVFEFALTASEKERILRVDPDPESGWGYPDFSIEVRLLDSEGNTVAEIERDDLFSAPDNRQSQYTKLRRFQAPQGGTYTLEVLPLATHLDHVDLEVRERK
jgi:hypothetical protein